MAEKVKMLKLLQEMRGMAEITQRRPSPRQPGLFLIQMRSRVANTQASRRKVISVKVQGRFDLPHPVKITHLQSRAPAAIPAAV
jgi:hypothetical protein